MKRKYEAAIPPGLESCGIETFDLALKELGSKSLATQALLILGCMNDVTLKDISQTPAPSFSNARWGQVAPKFGLDPLRDTSQLETFSVPRVYLPPSFHEEVMQNSVQWLDVYQEIGSQSKEAARVRLMDAWHVPICALFRGRVVDRPEHPMPRTSETSGGFIEHEVYMVEGIILIVIEMKLQLRELNDYFAQVFLELVSAYELNKEKNFANQPSVYAALTDLKDFHFICYDGSKFMTYQPRIIFVQPHPRSAFLDGMSEMAEHLFSIILEGYISNLSEIVERSKARGNQGDVSEHNSASVGEPKIKTPGGPRPSLDNWSRALAFAKQAQDALTRVNYTSMETWEQSGSDGLSLLQSSVSLLPKIGSSVNWSNSEAKIEIAKVLRERLRVLNFKTLQNS